VLLRLLLLLRLFFLLRVLILLRLLLQLLEMLFRNLLLEQPLPKQPQHLTH
jgi:hypothetical protein